MEVPKKVNGKECQQKILRIIALLNMHIIGMRKWNPEVDDDSCVIHATAVAMSQIVMAKELVALAKMFDINAELSSKEDLILVDGKVCRYSDHRKPKDGASGLS